MNIFKMCPKSWLQNQLCKHPVVFHSFLFFSFFLVNVSLKTSIIFMENKNITLTIMYPLQVRRETEFSPQTGKPNKKVSKTALDNRQSFINKDVLPMKIITAAKQNITQDTELLSEFCQQTFFREALQCRGQATIPFPVQSSSPPVLNHIPAVSPAHLCTPRGRSRGPRASQQSVNKGWYVWGLNLVAMLHQFAFFFMCVAEIKDNKRRKTEIKAITLLFKHILCLTTCE